MNRRCAVAARGFFAPRLRSWLLVAGLVCVIVAVSAPELWACPMCKAALGSQGRAHGDWVGGFFWSILFMVSMPFVLLGSFSTYMYVLVKRARREAAERQSSDAATARAPLGEEARVTVRG